MMRTTIVEVMRVADGYNAAGVDVDAGNEAVERYRQLFGGRRDPRILEGIGGFAGCFELREFGDGVLVASTDGVGTKLLIAAALGRFDTVGRDLVHHCINDILCMNAQPLFFLDYLAVGKLDPAMAASVVGGVANACEEFGVALLGGETAEMPDMYQPPNFDLAGTIVGAVRHEDMIDPRRIVVGDVVIGLPANGFHTNGYSLVRKILSPGEWNDALLAIHPCYLPHVRALQQVGISIKAMAHITGGGLTHNVARVMPDHLGAHFDSRRWRVPPLMERVVRDARLDSETAYRTFNMGVGFCVIVDAADVERTTTALDKSLALSPLPEAAGAQAAQIGEIEPRGARGPAVIIS